MANRLEGRKFQHSRTFNRVAVDRLVQSGRCSGDAYAGSRPASPNLTILSQAVTAHNHFLLKEQFVPENQQLFYNLVTRDALLIYDGVAHSLEGPFQSREDAERAAEELIERLEDQELDEQI